MKKPLWKHVDTLFLLYTWKEQHDVEERKLEKLDSHEKDWVMFSYLPLDRKFY